ncbi:long-chain acyl-CoA synthetase [Anaerovibrio lipolyticus DSM 3074]|uniref:Long-chain acyl-CoA synthetase n=1 Tax=Anaerovibrio lipolyticus DSM 3074 TaxID=1120997 RepID=A0A1M5ZX76_9FIRM|nr:class I adenylate-forming enzyme family protein [Anaerovibrio lipolyticus]SHI28768.1 long-chain acyl-CoA synthetase [Anaerovibrio lipolyticus DSM 3074]
MESVVEYIFFHANKQPDKLCLVDQYGEISYGNFKNKIITTLLKLKEVGINKGDRVIVEAEHSITYLALEAAVQLLGGIFVPIENNCASTKMNTFVQRAEADLIVTIRPIQTSIKALLFKDFSDLVSEHSNNIQLSFPKSDDISEMLFSTGTTGKEKGIVMTHGADIALAENVITGVEMEHDNVEIIPSPLNHSHGLRRYYANMVCGGTVVLIADIINTDAFFEYMDKYKVNAMDIVPAALTIFLRMSEGRLADYQDTIRYIQLGAAPLPESDQEELCRLLPKSRLYNFYGSTESGCIAIYNFNRPNTKKKCIGRPTCNAIIRIIDENNNEVPRGKTGLLSCCGTMNMQGYWKDEEETSKVLRDGVVYNSDEAYIDVDGDIILLGRKGDIINVGGKKVSPEEVEEAAREMPAIKDSACIPLADATVGQVPKLFVVLQQGVTTNEVDIKSFLQSVLEPYKVPRFIEFVDSIPRTFNGKIKRKELLELHKEF